MKQGLCKLDFSAYGTLAAQLADNIGRAIACGDLKPGDKLPSIAQMAERCGTSVRVSREAVRILENEGVLKGRPRLGLVVLEKQRFVWRGSVLFVSYGRQSYYYRGVLHKNIAQRLADEGWRVDHVNILLGEGTAEKQMRPLRRALQNGPLLVFGADLDPLALEEIRRAAVPYFAVAGLTGTEHGDAAGFISFSEAKAIVEMAEVSAMMGVKRALRIAIDDADQLFSLPFEQRGIATEQMVVHPETGIGRFENSAGEVYRRVRARVSDPRRPKVDLLYFADDSFTSAGLWAIQDAGLRIPDQIRVASLSNKGNRPFCPVALTCVEHDLVGYARTIARRLLAFLDGKKPVGRMTCAARLIRGKTL